jgi:hypothetical protein
MYCRCFGSKGLDWIGNWHPAKPSVKGVRNFIIGILFLTDRVAVKFGTVPTPIRTIPIHSGLSQSTPDYPKIDPDYPEIDPEKPKTTPENPLIGFIRFDSTRLIRFDSFCRMLILEGCCGFSTTESNQTPKSFVMKKKLEEEKRRK